MSEKKRPNNRANGNRYETDIILKRLKPIGYYQCVSARAESKRKDDLELQDIIYTDPFRFQCKSVKTSINYDKLLKAMKQDHLINVVLHRRLDGQLSHHSALLRWKHLAELLYGQVIAHLMDNQEEGMYRLALDLIRIVASGKDASEEIVRLPIAVFFAIVRANIELGLIKNDHVCLTPQD